MRPRVVAASALLLSVRGGREMTKANELPRTNATDQDNPNELLLRFQQGDESALDGLWAYYLPRLQRWTRARLGMRGHDGVTAEDLVQEAFVKSLPKLRTFQPRGPASLFNYFRTILLNLIRDHARSRARRPLRDDIELETHVHPGPSPLEQVLRREMRDLYQEALAGLPDHEQELVVAVVEQHCTDQELAMRFAKPSRDAARMARSRAMARLTQALASPRPRGIDRSYAMCVGQ
jgi:RNA polymerase sigma factor (sigma-70 family)